MSQKELFKVRNEKDIEAFKKLVFSYLENISSLSSDVALFLHTNKEDEDSVVTSAELRYATEIEKYLYLLNFYLLGILHVAEKEKFTEDMFKKAKAKPVSFDDIIDRFDALPMIFRKKLFKHKGILQLIMESLRVENYRFNLDDLTKQMSMTSDKIKYYFRDEV